MNLKTYEDHLEYLFKYIREGPNPWLRCPKDLENAFLKKFHNSEEVREHIQSFSLAVATINAEGALLTYEIARKQGSAPSEPYKEARWYLWKYGPRSIVQDEPFPEDLEERLRCEFGSQQKVKQHVISSAIEVVHSRRGPNARPFRLLHEDAFPEDTE